MKKKIWVVAVMAMSLSTSQSWGMLPSEVNMDELSMVAPKDNVGKYICQRPKEKNRPTAHLSGWQRKAIATLHGA